MGYDKTQGERLKLGFVVAPTTIMNVLRRYRLLPAPQRGKRSWRTFLKHYRQQMVARFFRSRNPAPANAIDPVLCRNRFALDKLTFSPRSPCGYAEQFLKPLL
jgi:hypothetical protein